MTIEHSTIPAASRHGPHSWEVANQTARLALTTGTADVGKACWQKSDHTLWICTAANTWVQLTMSPSELADLMSNAARVDQETGTLVDGSGNPVAGEFIKQEVRSEDFTLAASDKNSRIPVAGDVVVEFLTSSAIDQDFEGIEIRRNDAASLTLNSGSGIVMIFEGEVVTTVSVVDKGSSILITPGSVDDEFFVFTTGA